MSEPVSKKIVWRILEVILLVAFGAVVGYLVADGDPNASREYGESNLPSNCRALIYESEADYYLYNKYSHEELLKSIFRNCGETGVLWNSK